MKLEQQVCTLEQAKRFVELGIAQDGGHLYVYVPPFPVFNDSLKLCSLSEYERQLSQSALSDDARALVGYYPALTVAELGVMLPHSHLPKYFKLWDEWSYKEEDGSVRGYSLEAHARAAFLIYLIENNFATAEEVNQRLNA